MMIYPVLPEFGTYILLFFIGCYFSVISGLRYVPWILSQFTPQIDACFSLLTSDHIDVIVEISLLCWRMIRPWFSSLILGIIVHLRRRVVCLLPLIPRTFLEIGKKMCLFLLGINSWGEPILGTLLPIDFLKSTSKIHRAYFLWAKMNLLGAPDNSYAQSRATLCLWVLGTTRFGGN